MRHEDAMAALAEPNLWQRMARRWLEPAGVPEDNHLRRDIGLEALPSRVRIPMLVLAWLH